jgi:DNA-binding response OmpR family regulator
MTPPLKRVLIVEDDAAIGDLLVRALVRFYDVKLVDDGGVAASEALAFQPDIVLLDVSLPNQDGFSIAKSLKSSPVLSKVPIIFLTAHDRSLDVVRGIQAGAKHYLTKPFKLEDVVQKVKKLVPV